jgi:RNA polymerase sigma-70 factor (ECF subfamily)
MFLTNRTIVEDLEIVKLIRNGDTAAFRGLVEKYHKPILGFIYRIVCRQDLVEDIGQEVFLCAYQSLDNFDSNRGVPFSAWLFTIARNRCFTELRKKKIRRECPIEDETMAADDALGPDGRMERKEISVALQKAVNGLEEPFRSTLIGVLEGGTIESLSLGRGLSRNTVKTRLFRAREKLKKMLTFKYGDGES